MTSCLSMPTCLIVHLKQINNNASVSGKSWCLDSPVMSGGKYLQLCFLFFLALYGKRVVKRPNAPADFTFLVPERDLLVKIKTSVETVQYSIEINMDEQRWDVIAEEMNLVFENFENLPFFVNNEEFKSTTLSLMGPGFQNQRDGESNVNDILKYKDEKTEFIKIAPCQRTLLMLDKEELERSIGNLKNKFAKIDPTWDGHELQTDPVKMSVIYSFITTYNIAFGEIERYTSEILSTLEALSDHRFPDFILRTNKTCQSSNEVKETEGELFDILECHGTKQGYHCTTVVTQPMQLTKFVKMQQINYRDLEITGPTEDWIFVKDAETEILEYAHCQDMQSAHPTCLTKDIENSCKQALSANLVGDIIKHCNFAEINDPIAFVQVTEGGVLIQRANAVASGQTVLSTSPPFIVYSPEVLTITRNGEETVLIPAVKIETLTIVESSLTEADLDNLEWTHKGESFIDGLDNEDYINLVLALIQLVLVPATIVWMCKMGKQKKMLKGLMSTVHGPDKKTIYKKNYSKLKGKDTVRS